jgi:peptidoglycan/xylan/chitin deacetylase (PgdA/CDA1 family)
MTGWRDLEDELRRWADAGLSATFWWRDDDAGPPAPALDRLLALAARHEVPLGLAVVPARLEPGAAERIAAARLATPLLHGLAHRNHASGPEKKSEFPPSRGLEAMREDLGGGLALLRAAFGARALAVLVPPWNRLAAALIRHLPALGIAGLSRHQARDSVMAAPGVRQVNCHVDLIDWPGSRGFVGEPAALALLCDHLAARRGGRADAEEPTGLLGHHLVQDEGCWSFLDALLALLTTNPAARFLAPATLFPEAARHG